MGFNSAFKGLNKITWHLKFLSTCDGWPVLWNNKQGSRPDMRRYLQTIWRYNLTFIFFYMRVTRTTWPYVLFNWIVMRSITLPASHDEPISRHETKRQVRFTVQVCAAKRLFGQRRTAYTTVKKIQVHPCKGTEVLHRPYGPYRE